MKQQTVDRDDAAKAGLQRYFTGRPCKRGHVCERYVGSRNCVDCTRLSSAEYPRKPGRTAAHTAAWRANNPEKKRQNITGWRLRNREKFLAHQIVANAVRSGKLSPEPCERCGTDILVHAHHEDYTRPLQVIWLCPTHHIARHCEIDAERAAASSSEEAA